MSAAASTAAPARAPLEQPDLRAVFRRHASGVAVVTAAGPHGPSGFTVTSLASVSARPPIVSFNVTRTASVWPVVGTAEHLGVHVLGAGDLPLAALFARSGADRFGPTPWSAGPHDVPVLDGVGAVLVVRVRDRVPAGDSVLVLADVVHAALTTRPQEPLVYHDGDYVVPVGAA